MKLAHYFAGARGGGGYTTGAYSSSTLSHPYLPVCVCIRTYLHIRAHTRASGRTHMQVRVAMHSNTCVDALLLTQHLHSEKALGLLSHVLNVFKRFTVVTHYAHTEG